MTVVVNDESKHSTFSRINIVICFIPCGGPTVICFIPCGSRAADPLDGHRNVTGRYTFHEVARESRGYCRGGFLRAFITNRETRVKPRYHSRVYTLVSIGSRGSITDWRLETFAHKDECNAA
ncbi:hypothetical protein J6590_068392 [Homalodisca vitripennis]|nr:hypothetical protein J6590_068392 [Homalodisca vitripennis]